jgi:periplasmic protein TonB
MLLRKGSPEDMSSPTRAALDSGIKVDAAYDQRQRRKMMLALAIMIAALVIVLVRDRSFWFGPSDTNVADSDTLDDGADEEISSPPTTGASPATATPSVSKPRKKAPPKAVAEPATPPPAVVARKALPPLEIEVVAGDSHRTVNTRSSTMKVDIPSVSPAPPPVAAAAQPVTTASTSVPAAERVKISPDAGHVLQRKVDPSYPMLARQMKVQGSVVLQALIGKDGLIQDLRVLSGPGILSTAAQEAVRQWRFKPYLQNGQAVETEANITVNFTISTF